MTVTIQTITGNKLDFLLLFLYQSIIFNLGVHSGIASHYRDGAAIFQSSTRTGRCQGSYDNQLPVHSARDTRLAFAQLARFEALRESDRGHSCDSRTNHWIYSLAVAGKQTRTMADSDLVSLCITRMVAKLRYSAKSYWYV